MCKLFIFIELEPFFYCFLFTRKLNMSNVKYILRYLNQYSPVQKYQGLYGTMISILLNMGEEYCGGSSYLWILSHFSTILWSPRHQIWVMWNRNDPISTNIHPCKNIKGSMGKWYPHSIKPDKNCANSLYLWS